MAEQGDERTDDDRPKQAFVIGRLRPGREVASTVHEVERLLTQEGLSVEAEVVKKKREVRKSVGRALKAGCDVVVAVGGDGTVLQVATALAGGDVPLAIVPTGTGNLLAGNLGIPKPPPEAVQTAVAGRRRRIDVGRVTVDGKQRAFTVACGVGFDADVMERTDSKQKGRWGKIAYVASAMLETRNIRNVRHDITIDGVHSTTKAAQVLIANFGRVPPGVTATGVRPDDGLLDIYVVRASGPLPALLAGWQALSKRFLGRRGGDRVFRAQARKIRIVTKPRRRVETDGSVVGKTPISVSIQPAALLVMVPQRKPGSADGGESPG